MQSISSEIQNSRVPVKLQLTAAITNFNYGHYLTSSVEAMIKQSRPADELILIDDASTDENQGVLDDLARRYPFIKIVKHKANHGVNRTCNEILEMAVGDYIYFGAADDLVLPGFFESAMSLLERYPDAPLCAGIPIYWHEYIDRQFATCTGMPTEPGLLNREQVWAFSSRGAFEVGGAWAIFKTADFKAAGGFRTDLKWLSDWFVIYALALGRGVVWTAKPTAIMRCHAGNYSTLGPKRIVEQRAVLRNLALTLVTKMPSDVQHAFRKSGSLALLPSLIARVLLSERQFWSQLSGPFWRVWFRRKLLISLLPIARALVPKPFRRKIARAVVATDPQATTFDLSVMKARKPL